MLFGAVFNVHNLSGDFRRRRGSSNNVSEGSLGGADLGGVVKVDAFDLSEVLQSLQFRNILLMHL